MPGSSSPLVSYNNNNQIRRLRVPKDGASTVFFPIRATKAGLITIQVMAQVRMLLLWLSHHQPCHDPGMNDVVAYVVASSVITIQVMAQVQMLLLLLPSNSWSWTPGTDADVVASSSSKSWPRFGFPDALLLSLLML